ncbi:MAG: hypothetical protein WC879_10730 [Melioribacteraceae bacterium]
MINFKKIGPISFLNCLIIIISLSGCNELLDKIIIPRSAVISIYKSPKFDDYKFKTVALIPIWPDDTTDQGTFYATNHFLNRLKEKFPNILFTMPKVDSLMHADSLAVNKIIDSVEKLKRLDIRIFSNTDFGYSVDEYAPDAMLIGKINKVINKTGFSPGRIYRRVKATLTSCDFTYYLVSLSDGRVLWKAHVLGEDGYYLYSDESKYVPLDIAISNGIDIMMDKIPFIATSKN